MTPEEIHKTIAAEENNDRIVWRMTLSAFACIAAAALLLLTGTWLHLPDEMTQTLAVLLLIGWVIYAFHTFRTKTVSSGVRDAAYWRAATDLMWNRWCRTLPVQIVALLSISFVFAENLQVLKSGDNHYGLILTILCVITFLILSGSVTLGPAYFWPAIRRQIQDELIRDHLLRGHRAGFFSLIVCLCALTCAGTWYPQYALAALPPVLALCISVSGLYFWRLQRRAARGD